MEIKRNTVTLAEEVRNTLTFMSTEFFAIHSILCKQKETK